MRISTKQKNSVASILSKHVVVKLNGIPQRMATMADEKLGCVERIVPDFSARVGARKEVVYGTVEIELKPDVPPIVRKIYDKIREKE